MLVTTTFLAIGTLFIAFLLRFLFALELDSRLKAGRERQDRLYIRRVLFPAPAHGWANGLRLAYSNPTPMQQGWQASPGANLVAKAASRIGKEA